MLVLQVLQGPDRGQRFSLPEGEPQLIGRSSEALPIVDDTVSRRHAELTPDDDGWYLNDLQSANGTFLNGVQIHERTRLSAGDQIKCGSTLLLFTLASGSPPPTEAIRLFEDGDLDVTVEGRTDPNADSMILAAPDPVRAARDHLRIVYAVAELMASGSGQRELLEAVMDLVFAEFRPDRGFILLGSDPASALDPVVVRYRERPKTVDEGRIPVSRTIIDHVLTRREGVLSTNAMNDNRFRSGDSVADYGIRSAICIPIVAGPRTFGVIQIDSQLAQFTFTDAQLELLSAVGRMTGVAMVSSEQVETRIQTERLAAMGQTVATLSHSIKNILQGLRGGADAVELALNRGDLDLAREGWPILMRNLDRILTLTVNMLAFSRQTTVEADLVDSATVVHEATDLIARHCEHAGIALIHDLDDDAPPVPLDASGVHQALMNLLFNAVEAAPAKRGIVTVATNYDAAAHELHIAVTDNGPGMDTATAARACDAFMSTKGQRGTGLGLAVARKIMEEHGGRLVIDSAPGAGTTVTLVAPTGGGVTSAADTQLPQPIDEDPLAEEWE